MSNVIAFSNTHSVTYVADNILKSFKDIIRLSGLDPSNFVNSWESNMRAIKTWLGTGDLTRVGLEIYNPSTDALITLWEMTVVYNSSTGDGSFWTDTDQLKYHLQKAGVAPSNAKYDIILFAKNGRPDVEGWSSVTSRSTEGMVRQTLGSTIEHNGLGATTSYWRK